DAEGHRAALALQPLAELSELLDDGGERLLARPAEQEAGMDHDQLGAARDRDPGGVVEHPDRHPVLLVALDVAEEPRQRRVHGQDDPGVAGDLAEPLGPRVVHPEAALEVDLAGAVAALAQEPDGVLRALARGNPCRTDSDRSHRADDSRCRPSASVW